MEKEKLRSGGENSGWDELRDVEMASETPMRHEARCEVVTQRGSKILQAAEGLDSVETDKTDENLAVQTMRENWGDFEKSRALFGAKTEMVKYEYGVIAENMPWEEFVQFCERMNELGAKSEREYEAAMFEKASELCGKGLCLPRSFDIAVRRYNVAKQFGEKRPERFYSETSLGRVVSGLTSYSGEVLERDFSAEDAGDGKDASRMHLSYDLENDRLPESDAMVMLVLDGSVIDDDEFDLVGGRPAMDRMKKSRIKAVLGRDETITDMFQIAWNKSGGKGGDYEIMSVAQWQNGGVPVETEREQKSRRKKLTKEAIFHPDKKELREFVDGWLEKVDDEELRRLSAVCKDNVEQGAEEAVRYFAEVLGIEESEIIWDEKEKRGGGRRLAVTGKLKLSAKDKKSKPEIVLGMVAHEMFHGYQSKLEKEWERGKVKEGTLEDNQARLVYYNESHYVTPEDAGWFYAGQIKEAQAYYFGDTIKKRLKKLKRGRG